MIIILFVPKIIDTWLKITRIYIMQNTMVGLLRKKMKKDEICITTGVKGLKIESYLVENSICAVGKGESSKRTIYTPGSHYNHFSSGTG